MCYNSDCRIEIKSRIDGETSTISTKGNVVKTSSDMRFDYLLDGDKCTLTVSNGCIVQSRRGEQNVKMTFRKGEQTECFLGNGCFSGTFSVFTHDLQCTMSDINKDFGIEKGFTLLIVYTIGEQKIELNFSAEYKI